ncbi:hypothetical protein CAEBREN_04016 [Caenorhabditis brenneri]|uniref:DUF7154 domain-containing protein n=1 Tax=Caenorhabditis brenneri TaxID=135651 RepID=G0NM34_CAEBE|nr:hypothetical protein CAEBREN_04016 [Caenorhabditis brenneri]
MKRNQRRTTPTGEKGSRADSCTRRTNTTILLAYSTDSLQSDVDYARRAIIGNIRNFNPYQKFANIRLDVKKEENIQYHSDLDSFNASVIAHPADSTIGYGDKNTGSDVFNVIEKFLNNDRATICGSIIYVLVKRYPNGNDVTDLITRLRANHVFVYFIVHNVKSGGSDTKSLFDMSSETNGFCIFMDTTNYWAVVNSGLAVLYRPYQFIAQNYVVFGEGRIEIPNFRIPCTSFYCQQTMSVITIQDHKLDTNFISLNYTISTLDGTHVFTGPDNGSGWPRFGSGIIAHPKLNGTVDYKLTIDYKFRTSQSQFIDVRMYSSYYHDFVPFNQQEEKCTRRINSTVLFAYSTDSDQFDFVVAFNNLLNYAKPPQFHGYTTYANIRFDTRQEEEIQYHSDIYSFNASVSNHWVNSSIGYGDTTTGSDVFRVIQQSMDGIVVLDLPYQFIAQNYMVSGSELDNNFVSLNYTLYTMDNTPVISYPDYKDPQFGTGLLAYKVFNGTVDYYKMKIDYIFKTTEPQVIELRMYSNFYQEFLPFASN